jgi:hypothetical protein
MTGRCVIAALVAVLVFAVAAPAGAADDPVDALPVNATWLQTLNAWRAASGLPAVTENVMWSDGAVKHSKYMVETPDYGHDEDSGGEWATMEGHDAGANGNVAASSDATKSDRKFVEQWITAPFHAAGLLDPKLASSGFGAYRRAGATPWPAAATLDVIRGRTAPDPVGPTLFPGDDSVLPVAQQSYRGGESPDPLSPCAGYAGSTVNTGTPLFVLLPQAPTAATLTATVEQDNATVDSCAYDETSYTNPDAPSQTLGRDVLAGRHQVVVIPKDPLTPGSHYDVSVSVTYAGAMAPTVTSWSFTAGSLPEVSIGNASVVEGNARTRYVRLTVSLNRKSTLPVNVQYATAPGAATAPSDFSAKAGTVTIPANGISTTVTLPIKGDQTLEPNETFTVHLSNPQNATIFRSTGSVQIRNDDKAGVTTNAARLSIGNATVVEGDSASRPLRFSVSLSTTKTTAVKVDYATSDGPAPAASSGDYAAKSGTITIPAGQTSAVLTITVRADTAVEPTERFTLKLSHPVGASIQFGTATGSIHNDDTDLCGSALRGC